jgi:hypothetical protein
MRTGQYRKRIGYLFITGGSVFLIAAFVAFAGKQVTSHIMGTMFVGLGAMAIAIGVGSLRRIRNENS